MATGRTLKYLRDTHKVDLRPTMAICMWRIRDLMVCRDGFSMSIQASPSHYCNLHYVSSLRSPYDTVPVEAIPFTSCEVYCLSQSEPLFEGLGEGDNPYGWVPLDLIDSVIAKHGGLACDPLPTMHLPTGKRSLDLT